MFKNICLLIIGGFMGLAWLGGFSYLLDNLNSHEPNYKYFCLAFEKDNNGVYLDYIVDKLEDCKKNNFILWTEYVGKLDNYSNNIIKYQK